MAELEAGMLKAKAEVAKAKAEVAKAKVEEAESLQKEQVEAVRQSFQAVHGMEMNPDKNWANVVLQVLLHVPSLWAHVLAHACSSSTRMCPAGILKKLSSARNLGPETTWGKEHCDEVFQDLDDTQDALEGLTQVFNAIRDCEGESVSVDRLVGVGSTRTIEDCKGHKSVSPPNFNYGVTLNLSQLKSRTEIQHLLEQWIAPVAILNYACKDCPDKVEAKQTTAYFPPPPAVLVVTLGHDSKGPGVHFLQPVFLPGTEIQYSLCAVIGCNAAKDHYWAVVKKMMDRKPPTWIKADDKKVTTILGSTLENKSYGKAAVVLVYENVDAALQKLDPEAEKLEVAAEEDLDEVATTALNYTQKRSMLLYTNTS